MWKGVGIVFVMVGIPVIVVVFVVTWCVYCFRSSRKKWRADDEARRDGAGAQGGAVANVGERGEDVKA